MPLEMDDELWAGITAEALCDEMGLARGCAAFYATKRGLLRTLAERDGDRATTEYQHRFSRGLDLSGFVVEEA